MCYPKPGPRCSSSAAAALVKAKSAARNFDTQNKGWDAYQEAKATAEQAEREYYMTPAGQRYLDRKILTSHGREADWQMKKAKGKEDRKAALKALTLKDKGDIRHDPTDEEKTILKNYATLFDNEFLADDEPRGSVPNGSAQLDSLVAAGETWTNKLNADEMESVAWFTSDGAHVMNHTLIGKELANWHKDDYSEEHVKLSIKRLDRALKKFESPEPVVVYRGAPEWFLEDRNVNRFSEGGEEKVTEMLNNEFKPGATYEFGTYMSTSLDPFRASSFGSMSGVMFEIKTRHAVPATNISAWDVSEREAIIGRKAKFRVVGVKKNVVYKSGNDDRSWDYNVVQLEEILD